MRPALTTSKALATIGEAPRAGLYGETELSRPEARPRDVVPPFQLIADGELVAADLIGTTGTRAAGGVEILMGTTRDEVAAFFGLDEASKLVTDHMFVTPMLRLARLLAERGNPAWLYRFDWHPAGSPYGACHCIELPFVFGDPVPWRDAPMLEGQLPSALLDEVQRAWTGFARHGDPGWARAVRPGETRWSASAHRFTG